MPADVYEDTLELTVGILEAVLPDNGQYLNTAYPYPSLKPTGRTEKRTFRTVVLENPYVKATIVPDLGGRILRLLDKRTSAEILPIEPLTPQAGGLRGVEISPGIQIRYGNTDRHNALSAVNVQPVPPDDEEDDAGVWIGEIGVGLSCNALISVPPDAAEVRLELRIFNRLVADTPYNGGIAIHLPGAKCNISSVHDLAHDFGFVAYAKARDCGLSIWCDSPETASARYSGGRLFVSRFGPKAKFALGPRQLDTWRFRLIPTSGLGSTPAASPDLAVEASTTGCRIQAHRKLSNPKLLVLTKAGQSLESSITAFPGHLQEISFKSLPSKAKEIAVVESDIVRVRHLIGSRFAPLDSRRVSLDDAATQETRARVHAKPIPRLLLKQADLLPSVRYEALLLRAASRSGKGGRPIEAAQDLEQALLYNSEDHLAWWQKARIQHSLQPTSEESPELLNAHFLAPLEPALRGESFLGQPHTMVREASPILTPLQEAPEQFVEVACELLEINFLAEASRFLDEALRHVDLPMLRYLQAFALLSGTNMKVDAAQHVSAAAAIPFSPPFPWRRTELNALRTLETAFPDDSRIKQYLSAGTLYKGPQSILSTE